MHRIDTVRTQFISMALFIYWSLSANVRSSDFQAKLDEKAYFHLNPSPVLKTYKNLPKSKKKLNVYWLF